MPATYKMKVNVEHRLSRSGICVVDYPEAVLGHSPLTGKAGSGPENMAYQ
jgi:hypothetical protein